MSSSTSAITGQTLTFDARRAQRLNLVPQQPQPLQQPWQQQPVAPIGDTFEVGVLASLRTDLSSANSPLSIAIGNAEGTRTVNGGFTRAWRGHRDPGNGRTNLGTFSFQRFQNSSVRTPQQADAAQLAILRSRIPAFETAARRAGLDPNDARLQAAFFDLSNQTSPRIWNRFLGRMGRTLGGRALTPQNLAAARLDAMFDDRGRFTARGLKNPRRALADQTRRTNAIEAVLQRNQRIAA